MQSVSRAALLFAAATLWLAWVPARASGLPHARTLFVKGATLESPDLDPILVVPGGSTVDASELIAGYRLVGFGPDDTLAFELDATGSIEAPVRIPPGTSIGVPSSKWLVYDPNAKLFVLTSLGAPVGQTTGPDPLDVPGTLLLRAIPVPEPSGPWPVFVAIWVVVSLRAGLRHPRARQRERR